MAIKLNIPDRQEEAVWVRAWCATASALGCTETSKAAQWADACLKDFKQRFRKEEKEISK